MSPGRSLIEVSGLSTPIGRCITAKLNSPSGAVTGSGRKTASLLW